MKTDKDIGSEVKHKLEGYKNSPDPTVWSAIESRLKKKRRKVLFWYFISGLATAVIFLIGFYTFDAGNVQDFKPSPQNTPTLKSAESPKDLRDQNTKDSSVEHNFNSIDETLKPSESNKTKNSIKTKGQLAGSKSIANKNKETLKVSIANEQNTNLPKNKNTTNTVNRNVNYLKTKLNDSISTSDSKSTINSRVSEIPLDSLKTDEALSSLMQKAIDSSKIDTTKKIVSVEKEERIKDSITQKKIQWSINPHFMVSKYGAFNAKTSKDLTLNYGILLGIKMSEKAFLRFGIKHLELMNTINGIENTVAYFEFPLEVKYLFNTNNLSPYVTGGFSLFNLKDSTSENALEYLETTASLNLGLGLEHKLFHKFYVTIESNFNYQIKPISKNADYNPFILSISTGFDYRF